MTTRQLCVAAWGAAILLSTPWSRAQAEDQGSAGKSNMMSAWTGASASLDDQYGYLGVVYAIGRDVDSDGPLARIGAGGGQYETSGNNSHRVDHFDVDAMLGYRKTLGPAIVALYAGAVYEQHDNSDEHADIRGAKLGLKLQAEAYTPISDAIFVSGFGNYSTAFNTFNVSTKLGYRLRENLTLGPEAAVLGCAGFDQMRAGLASALRIGESTELAISAGAAWKLDENDFGAYGGINLYTKF